MLNVPTSTLLSNLQNIPVKHIGKYSPICKWGNQGPSKAYVFLIKEFKTSLSPGSKPFSVACGPSLWCWDWEPEKTFCPLSAASLHSAHSRHQKKRRRLEEKGRAVRFHSIVLNPQSSHSFQFPYFSTLRAIKPPQKYQHQLAGTPSQRVKNRRSRDPPPRFWTTVNLNSSLFPQLPTQRSFSGFSFCLLSCPILVPPVHYIKFFLFK